MAEYSTFHYYFHQTAEYGTFHRDHRCAKGSGVGVQNSLNFSQVRLSSAQFPFVYEFLYFIANNGEQLSWRPWLRKENIINNVHHILLLLLLLLNYLFPGAPKVPIINDLGCAFAILYSLESIDYLALLIVYQIF